MRNPYGDRITSEFKLGADGRSDFGVGIGDIIKNIGTTAQTAQDLVPHAQKTFNSIDAAIPPILETNQTVDLGVKVVAGTVFACGLVYIWKTLRGK